MEVVRNGEGMPSAPYTSSFGGFNYYPTSAFKRSASSTPQLRGGYPDNVANNVSTSASLARRASPKAGPLLRRYRASSSPILPSTRPKEGDLHSSSNPIPVKTHMGGPRASNDVSDTGRGGGTLAGDKATSQEKLQLQQQHQSRSKTPYSQRRWADGDRSNADTRTPSPTVTTHTTAVSAAAPMHKAPWNRSSTPSTARTVEGSTGKRPSSSSSTSPSTRHGLSQSPEGVTPTVKEGGDSRGSTIRRALASESPFLPSYVSTTGSHAQSGDDPSEVAVCADSNCMHSRRSIAEFIEMQRELRRCYACMQSHETELASLREKLAAAEERLAEKDAQAEARLHEREKEFLVEMARREREIEAEVWEQAQAQLCHADTATGKEQLSEETEESGSVTSGDDTQDAVVVAGRLDSSARREAREPLHGESANAQLLVDMSCTIAQLEKLVEDERAERHAVLRELRVMAEERTQLQTHVRLLSAWKEERMQELEREEAEKRRLWGQKRLVSPTPPRPPTASANADECTPRTAVQTPLQKLLARSTSSLSPSPLPAPAGGAVAVAATATTTAAIMPENQRTPQRWSGDAETEAAEHLVTIRRSPTPRRPAPEAPLSLSAISEGNQHACGPAPEPCLRDWRRRVGASSCDATTNTDTNAEPSPSTTATQTPAWEAAEVVSSHGSTSLVVSEARCRELLRALLDKERQLAEIAAERTLYRRRLDELGLKVSP